MTRAVYPGTFDPVHNGHLDIIGRAAHLFEELIVAVFDHRAAKQPIKNIAFSTEERMEMILTNLQQYDNISVQPYNTLTVNFAREMNSQVIVRGLRVYSDFEYEFRMAHANQRLAPGIDVVTLIAREEHTFLSGTTVREIASFGGNVSTMVPSNVEAALKSIYEQ